MNMFYRIGIVIILFFIELIVFLIGNLVLVFLQGHAVKVSVSIYVSYSGSLPSVPVPSFEPFSISILIGKRI